MTDNNLKICLIVVDSLRADHLSCYGYNKKTSPNIDNISKKSVLFKNAISQSNWTYSALYSLLSSTYPTVNDVGWFDQKINNSFITLPEILQKQGYHTALFSSFKTLVNRKTFGSHFNETKQMGIDENTVDFVSKWFKDKDKSFLMFHIGDYVHEPYFADKQYVDMFYDKGYDDLKLDAMMKALTTTATKDQGEEMRDINRKLNMHLERLSKKQLDYIFACYDAGIYYVDKFIGKFYDMMKDEHENVMFIITADHGQSFFEHGFYGHGLHLYDDVTRVPLIVNMNDNYTDIIEEPVQHIDIYPSILELLKIKESSLNLNGDSFANALSLQKEKIKSRIAISEANPFISIRTKDKKLITTYFRLKNNQGTIKELYLNIINKKVRRFLFNIYAIISPDKLYNIQLDSKEEINVKGTEKNIYEKLCNDLKKIYRDIRKTQISPVSVKMEEEIEKQLKDLGYM